MAETENTYAVRRNVAITQFRNWFQENHLENNQDENQIITNIISAIINERAIGLDDLIEILRTGNTERLQDLDRLVTRHTQQVPLDGLTQFFIEGLRNVFAVPKWVPKIEFEALIGMELIQDVHDDPDRFHELTERGRERFLAISQSLQQITQPGTIR